MTAKKSADEIYDDNSEAARGRGVRPKSAKPPPNKGGKVTVTHKKVGNAMHLLSKYQLAVIVANTVAGLCFIWAGFDDPAIRAHAMWAYGIANGIAAVPCFFNKRE